jgi:putative ABC transport system substrate-binding protein
MYRVGYLGVFRPVTGAALENWNAFVNGLRERGWAEGRNLVIERRYPAEASRSYPDLVAELLRLPVDVLVTASSEAAWAAKKSTSTTPIVVAVSNLVEQGLAASLRRPGGNLTGISNQLQALGAKRYQLLRELAPQVAREAIVITPTIRPRRVRSRSRRAKRWRLG